MPSFLNKVFGYKKHDDKETARPTREPSDTYLLDGKYEAISPVHSPSASNFSDSDRDGAFSFFKPKSRGVSQKPSQKNSDAFPHLTLRLPSPKEGADSRQLAVVFEADPDAEALLDDAVIAAKRLTPLEALILVRSCAQAITERGLETLGVMHPHWFSASPDVQRKLISLYIRSLTPENQPSTLSTKSSPKAAFENELQYTRSSHDVAAVLRWGLRHLSLDNGHFGKDTAEWAWYDTFFNAERHASYPPEGFSELLLPQLPPSHVELLNATLNLISSLASHAEANGISGSKLSKFLGLWLLAAIRAEQSDDWSRFYARWERAGRILEHLFLVRLREESFAQRLPTRLLELVKHYPYRGSSSTEDDLLPRPRFSTRQYDALLVRVESVLVQNAEQPKKHPIQLLLEAFQLPIENPSADEYVAFWNTLKTTVSEQVTSSSSDSDGLQFARVFADETIQVLSLIPADDNVPATPILLSSPIAKIISGKSSSSPTKGPERTPSMPVSPTLPSSPVVTDWAQFSLSGFGDAPTTQSLGALLDPTDDIETSQPRSSRKSSRQRGKSRSRRRRSQDRDSPATLRPEDAIIETKLGSVHVVQIDEAFIDFWSDAIVDPISSNWPTFLICSLKQVPNAEQPMRWLVIEQAYSYQQLQPPRVPSPDGHRGRSPRPSFKSDISGFRINSMFSSARKRLSVFSKSVTDLDPRKSASKPPITGEVGGTLVEEEPVFPAVRVDENAAVRTTTNSNATASVVDQVKVEEVFPVSIAPSDQVSVLKENSGPVPAVVKVPSIEPALQSGGESKGSSGVPRSLVGASQKDFFSEEGIPFVGGSVDPKASAPGSVANVAPVVNVTLGTNDPVALPLGPALITQHAVEDARTAIVEDNKPFLVESASELSNATQVGTLEGAMPPTPEDITTMVATPAPPTAVAVVDNKSSGVATDSEPRVAEQPSYKTPADLAAASTVESLVAENEKDDIPSLSTTHFQDGALSTEAGAQLEPDSVGCTVNAVQEAKEVTEIPTPAPQVVALVAETPSLDVYGQGAAVAQVPAAELGALEVVVPLLHDQASALEALDNAAPQSVTAELAGAVKAADASMAHTPTIGFNAQVVVQAEHTADLVPTLATEEASLLLQDGLLQAAKAPRVGADSAVHESADITSAAVRAQAASESTVETGEDMGVPTPVPEATEFVHETPSPETANESVEPVDVAPTIIYESEVVDIKVCETAVGTVGANTRTVPLVNGGAKSIAVEELSPHVPATQFSPSTVVVAASVEDTSVDPVTQGAQVHVEDGTRSASEPIAMPPTVISEPSMVAQEEEALSREVAAQSVDEAAKPFLAVSVPEDTNAVYIEVEAQLMSEAVHTTEDNIDVSPQEVAEDVEPVLRERRVDHDDPSVEVTETGSAPAEAKEDLSSGAAEGQAGAAVTAGEVHEMSGVDGSQLVASDVEVSAPVEA